MGISLETLQTGPFETYLVPGIFLLVVLELGNLFGAVLSLRRLPVRGYAAGILGIGMIGWIVVQCIILLSVVAPHVLYFLIGSAEGILASVILLMEDRFPVPLIQRILGLGSAGRQLRR